MLNKRFFLAVLLLVFALQTVLSQSATEHSTYVDAQGVLRWSVDNSEIHGFGVNYSTPFAHAFRMAKRMGVNHEEAIRQDVYHFARLGFNLYRVHVWDTEISDTLGNLLHNEHLRLFDFAVAEMKQRGMKFVITPIAFWGNGWPEPDFDTPGFARKYGKAGCLTHPDAIKAQENYLYQFLNHVNPYTGIAYKDDPDVVAFEVSNEPHHPGTVEEVKDFINRMVASMRRTGTQTPIFYNVTHSIHLYRAYMEADVQGGTFQWYPTGLVANRQINGNFLPHVSTYHIPFADDPDFRNMAKIVYEFDAADAEGNYMYPAMARSFRQAGMQLATHFDYDAMFLAPFNTNYGTHFMSLPYAPQKAISLMIASQVFHQVPRYADFGSFPHNNTFANFRIRYEEDLAELVSPERFYYTNHTPTVPPDVNRLTSIAGYGNSAVVRYDGKGAYFLDKLAPGVWRLEVMPDAHWIGDPYARVSPHRQVAAVHHTQRAMQVALPGLGSGFSVKGIDEGNTLSALARNSQFEVLPGVYLLQAAGNTVRIDPQSMLGNIRMNEFVAPESNLEVTLVKNHSAPQVTAGAEAHIRFELISPRKPGNVTIAMWDRLGNRQMKAEYLGNDIYQLSLPSEIAKHGILHYFVVIDFGDHWRTFPAGIDRKPGDWDFYDQTSYTMHFIPEGKPIALWCAMADNEETLRPWVRGVDLRPAFEKGKGWLFYDLEQIPNNQDGTGRTRIHTIKYNFRDQVAGRKSELNQKEYLVMRGANLGNGPVRLEVSLIDKSGNVFTHDLILNEQQENYRLALKDFKEGQFAMIPRPYPEFKPWHAAITNHGPLVASDLEVLQITLQGDGSENNIRFYLQEAWLE